MMFKNVSSLLLLLAVGAVDGQITYRAVDDVTEAWTATTGEVSMGNGMFASPKYNVVVALSSDCTLKAFEPTKGQEYWTYTPSSSGSCKGGVFFTDNYIAYLVSDITTDTSAIHAVAYTGDNLFTTGSLQGTGVGTPVATASGQYLMANSNTRDDVGSFTVFNIETPESAVYTYQGQDPFGEIGYFYSPQQGYFVGGFENKNDVFIWSTGIPTTFTGGADINGTTYAFQLPIAPSNALNVTVMAEDRAFVSNEPPVLANGGLNMYWSTYKNEFWAWAGTYNVKRNAFDQRGVIKRATGRGDPRYISARAPPTVSSSNGTAPTVYGPQADGFIFKATFNFTEFASFATNDQLPISNRVIISPDETVLFYGSSSGSLVQLDADSMNTNYAIPSSGFYTGEIAQSVDGAFIYAADTSGAIRAYQVADVVGGPTLEPLPGVPTETFAPTPAETDGNSNNPDDDDEPTSEPDAPSSPVAPSPSSPTPGRSPSAPSPSSTTPGGPPSPSSPTKKPVNSGSNMVGMTLCAIAITISALFV